MVGACRDLSRQVPHKGVRYAGGGGQGSDPDAKPACGTPRAGRRAAAVALPLVLGRRAGWSGTDGKRGLPLGRPEALTPHDTQVGTRAKTKPTSRKRCWSTTRLIGERSTF